MKLPNPDYFSHLSAFEVLHLQEMAESVVLYLDSLRDDIKSKIDSSNQEQYDSEHEHNSYMDSLNDEIAQLQDVEDISKKLSVVGLYMVVERFIKKIMRCLYHDLDEDSKSKKLRTLYRWDFVVQELGILCRPDITEVAEFSIISELRTLNNLIKHDGYVDEYLVAFATWKNELNKEIDANLIDLDKYGEAIPKYIRGFVEKINLSQPSPS